MALIMEHLHFCIRTEQQGQREGYSFNRETSTTRHPIETSQNKLWCESKNHNWVPQDSPETKNHKRIWQQSNLGSKKTQLSILRLQHLSLTRAKWINYIWGKLPFCNQCLLRMARNIVLKPKSGFMKNESTFKEHRDSGMRLISFDYVFPVKTEFIFTNSGNLFYVLIKCNKCGVFQNSVV